MRWLLVVAAFIVVPLAELWAILAVGREIGVGPTILVLLADSVIGALLLRAQGRGAWRRFVAALEAGRLPNREIADGLLIMLGGAFLLTPGFLTDLVGLALLVPPTRALLRRALERGVARRLTAPADDPERGGFTWRAGSSRPGARARRPFDVEGKASERAAGPPPGGPRLDR
jgi:UPF0716 protein FxsA